MTEDLINEISSGLAYHICDQNYEDMEPETLTEIIHKKLKELLNG